ncbi:hypothetical protein FOMPIDRAFT_1050972 [Fomitopsis schrenkii]|uniref:Cytochrome P450 n=1 Tax=Fomitopsis schrenkii TaxID=2126942 RepID=S8E6F0_FOMSC|nr:hypothetical protein FOMPIDRAFT_1050972 [Fomitopsis schrenkii]
MPPSIVLVSTLALVVALAVVRYTARRRYGRFPPGPPGYPIIGNILDMPPGHGWRTFAQWSEKWGDIISVHLLGKPIVILNSSHLANDILGKKSAIYSDRPLVPVAGELMGWRRILVLHRYGPRWREIRRLFSQTIGTHNSLMRLADGLEQEACEFVRRIAADPTILTHCAQRFAAVSALTIAYGCTAEKAEGEILEIANTAVEQFTSASAPGAYLADAIPILTYIPAWFPGAGWKRTALEWRKDLIKMCDIPYEFAKTQLFVEDETVIKDAASSMYAGVPHRLTQDDLHDGYFFPKGTVFITNIWSMMRDPRCYSSPEDFNPDRFLAHDNTEPEYDPRHIVFGFGRRVCPGSQLAELSLFMTCAVTLATLEISKPILNGKVIEPSMEYTAGTVSHPCEFQCSIKLRSSKTEALLALP